MVICCLLALLAALPGAAFARRMQVGGGQLACNVPCAPAARGFGIAMAATVIAISCGAVVLIVHVASHDTGSLAFGPVCSTLNSVIASR